jgi:transcriptional regulator with XRE-family HTH domain
VDESNENFASEEVQPDIGVEDENKKKILAKEIAARIKTLAKDKGVSPQTVMIACGIQRNFLTHMSIRGSIPAADSFMLIADYFNVTLDFLFGRPDRETEYSNTLLGFEKALIKEGVTDKTLSPNMRNMFFELLLNQVAFFLKVVTRTSQPMQIPKNAAAKAPSYAMKPVDDERKLLANEIAENIKFLAKSKGIPYGHVLNQLGYLPTFVTNMSHQGSIPSADLFIPIADYFDVSLDFLLCRPKKGVAYQELLKGLEGMLIDLGLTDESLAPKDRDIYFELIKNQTATFMSLQPKKGKKR